MTQAKVEKYPPPFDAEHRCIFCGWKPDMNDSGSVPDQLRRHNYELLHLRDHEERKEVYRFTYAGLPRWRVCR